MPKMKIPAPHAAFEARKSKILSQLATPDAEYTDASPKGSVDEGVRDLIGEINGRDGLVTTSSCAGRVSVFVEGSKKTGRRVLPGDEEDDDGRLPKPASAAGGKGGGGTWLFVSHDPVDEGVLKDERGGGVATLFGLGEDSVSDEDEDGGVGVGGVVGAGESRLIHFKFEPMVRTHMPRRCVLRARRSGRTTNHTPQILHILTSSPHHAQLVLKCGLAAGFRESGAVSLLDSVPISSAGDLATPIVAVRSMGLSFESLVGVMDAHGRKRSVVSPEYLKMLVRIGNERFVENRKRIRRFLEALRAEMKDEGHGEVSRAGEKELRRERKRAEGLRRQAEAKGRPKEELGEVEAYIDDLAEDSNLS